jgi:hypothetical protein
MRQSVLFFIALLSLWFGYARYCYIPIKDRFITVRNFHQKKREKEEEERKGQ